MPLVANWRRVLRRAWSVHLSAAAFAMALLSGIDAAWPLLAGVIPISPVVFALLACFFSVAAVIARVIYQDTLHAN